jgi:ubiquinone/menaquinone biosynthesis C-methylase UbiE
MRSRPSVFISVVALLVVSVAGVIGWRFAIFVIPVGWTAEPARLANLLRVRGGSVVADIGAGDGALAVEMARLVGARGVVYATELSAERRGAVTRRVSQAGTPQVRVVEAVGDATRLPPECCDAVYMRAVFHHIDDPNVYAREVRNAVRPGGRVAIIDFSPGTLWFHGREHGVTRETVTQVFEQAGLSLIRHIDDWGGGTYLLLFERPSS